MRPSDIVNQLRILLPHYTTRFHDALSISSISVSSGVGTIVTSSPHNLLDGEALTLANVEQRTPISTASKEGMIVTFTTSVDHDLTENWHEQITLSGFTDTQWNGTFELNKVPNRRTFSIRSANAAPAISGSPVLHEVRIDGPNGQYSVTVVDENTLTINTDADDGIYFSGTAASAVRVISAATIERSQEQYDEMEANQYWMFVVPQDAEISKDRTTQSDAVSTQPNGTEIRTRLIDPFSLYVFAPTDQQFAAENALDVCRHDLLTPLTKSLYGARFPSGLSTPMDFRVVLTSHGVYDYTEAYYIHQYDWESVYDLTDGDAVDNLATRAFRDLNFIKRIGGDDTENATASINLDDEPL